jgi:hypothetical protein
LHCNPVSRWHHRYNGAAYFTTSAKNADAVEEALKLIPAAAEAQYGRVWKLTSQTQASGHFEWPVHGGKTELEFVANATGLTVLQDGRLLGATMFAEPLEPHAFGTLVASTGPGIFGPPPVGVDVHVVGL